MTADFFDRTLPEWTGYIILLMGFLLTLIIQLGFYLKLLFVKMNDIEVQEKPISILMSVRNEEDKIEAILTQLANQNYSDFEIVVVDDFSEDATLTIIGVLSKKYPQLKFSSLTQETRYSEKIAINLALKAAKFEQVVYVNPAVSYVDPQFLKLINSLIAMDDDVVMSYTNYEMQKGFFNHLSRVERFTSFLTSAAFSSSGMSVFFNQDNVVFPKQDYFSVDGFRGNINAHYANLELLLNKIKKRKVVISVNPESQLREAVDVRKNDFLELVRKRLLLIKKLNIGKKLLLSLSKIGNLLLLMGFIWLMITEIQNWMIFSIPLVIVFIVRGIILKIMLKRLKEKKIFLFSLVYGWIRTVFDLYCRIKIYFHFQHYKWN